MSSDGRRRMPGSSCSSDNDPFENNKKQKTSSVECAASASHSAHSSSQSSPPWGEYEVFLNFRGPDTRYRITDILYRFLVNLKIRTFRDDDELRKGEEIWPNLARAIEQSKIYVPIFSEGYADSKWCLRELAAIVEHQERNQGCIILPIFYMVDPRDVRHQSGPYRDAFQQHEQNIDEETIRIWKDTLNTVGALKGWHVRSNDEQGAIADLVTGVVWSHLSKNNNVLEIDKLIGIDDHVEAVKERMALDSPCMKIVGIHGMGGIGKTTIAKAVYNKVSTQFDRCSFVENVREMLEQKDGVITLQKHIISNILRVDFAESILNNSEGIKTIRERVSRFKFLVVLDDVDEKFEFDKILGNIENFVSGSRFIITSRNVKVLSTLADDIKLYRVQEMSERHSLQLFCNHAFKKDIPPLNYETLSNDIVSVAAGLPLTLKVVGSLLFQEEEEIWKDKLKQLKEIPEQKVVDRLKISYDTLNEEAKQIFLDIACFFIGEDKEFASYMWSDLGFFPTTNINILNQRSMIGIVVVDEGSRKKVLFQMHDQLRDMGREIVRQENTRHPWSTSRIWSMEKALNMLLNKKGTNQVEGIRMRYDGFRKLDDFNGEELGKISKECFMNLSELRYLDIQVKVLIDDLGNYVPNLRWVRFRIGTFDPIPKFSVKNLVILEVRSFSVSMRADGCLRHIKMASKLKVLKLYGYCIDDFPEFPHSGSLEILELVSWFGNPRFRRDLDIGNLRNLKELRLENCGEITGGRIGMMPWETLKVLYLEDCEVREITGGTLGMMPLENMKAMHLLPSSLTSLHIVKCQKLEWLPNLENLENLTDLYIYGCPLLKEIRGLQGLKSLKTMRLRECPLLKEILGLRELKSLETLNLSGLNAVRSLEDLDSLYSLKSLEITACSALKRLPSTASLSKRLRISIRNCSCLTEIQGLGGLEPWQAFHLQDVLRLMRLHGFETVPPLIMLGGVDIRGCPLLTSIIQENSRVAHEGE